MTDKDSHISPAARLASVYSWVLNPLAMPVVGTILIFALSVLSYIPMGTKVQFTLIIAGITMVLPMMLVFLLKLFGLVKDVALNNQKERLLPYLITVVSFLLAAWFMWSKRAPIWVCMFYVGGAASGLVNAIVNRWWKISAHAAGAAGVVAMLVRLNLLGMPQYNMVWWIVGAVLATGLLGTARIYLRRHTFWQVMAGYASGFTGVFLLTAIN